MTASPLYFPPSVETAADRRRHARIRLMQVVHVQIGRGQGELIDISTSGARLRHSVGVARGSRVRVRFSWRGRRVSLSAEVLASRVVALARPSDGATVYESRLRFVGNSAEDLSTLKGVVEALHSELLSRFVANLRGLPRLDSEHVEQERTACARIYIRCTRDGNSWKKHWTRSPQVPKDGFLIPADTPPAEVDLLCRTYERLDEDGRHLLRLMAAAAIEPERLTASGQ